MTPAQRSPASLTGPRVSAKREYHGQPYLHAGDDALILRTMALPRRIRHQASRRQLIREAFYSYVFAFVIVLLELHFVGTKHYSPSFYREYGPVKAAVLQALVWALIGPVWVVLHEFVLRQSDLWRSYSSLDWQIQRLVLAGAVAIIAATVLAWRWMLPLWGLAVAVVLYLRFTRPKDSL